jgi:hypothetical protein
MSTRSSIERRRLLGRCAGTLTLSFALGCTAGDEPARSSSSAGSTGDSGACIGTEVVAPKRVVRLTEHQLFNAYAALFGTSAAAIITEDEEPPSLEDREIPPIGADIGVGEGLFAKYDRLAQAAMAYVSANADTLTPCGATPSDATCVQSYLPRREGVSPPAQ